MVVDELPTKVTQQEDTPRDDPEPFCPACPSRAVRSANAGAVFAELSRAGLPQLIEAEATATIGAAASIRRRAVIITSKLNPL